MIVGYCPGSGFTPLISGSLNSGFTNGPVGGIMLYAYPQNSGLVYISFSGAFVFSGQVGCLPASGGPTIQSGTYALSGVMTGSMDGQPIPAGASFYVPKILITNTGAYSGTYQLCLGADPACSGTNARIHWIEM